MICSILILLFSVYANEFVNIQGIFCLFQNDIFNSRRNSCYLQTCCSKLLHIHKNSVMNTLVETFNLERSNVLFDSNLIPHGSTNI